MPCLVTGDTDPNSKNGMMTKVWGPAGWLFLHCVSFGYPDDPDSYDEEHGYPPGTTRTRYSRFFTEVGNVLPCRYCRDSYKDFEKDDPILRNNENRSTLVEWLWRIHNKVNQKLGVHYCDASLEELKTRYESYRAKCKALTPDERIINSEKGCVIPADGTPKQCLIDVVKTKKGDVTRRSNASDTRVDDEDNDDEHNGKISKNLSRYFITLLLIILALYVGYKMGLRHSRR